MYLCEPERGLGFLEIATALAIKKMHDKKKADEENAAQDAQASQDAAEHNADIVKWPGGKAGDVNEMGIAYGTSQAAAQPIIDAYNARQVAAAAGYNSIEEYNVAAAKAAHPVAAVAAPVSASKTAKSLTSSPMFVPLALGAAALLLMAFMTGGGE